MVDDDLPIILLKRGSHWHYKFQFLGALYRGTTKQRARSQAAKYVEMRARLEAEAAGITAPLQTTEPIPLHDWAAIHLEDCRARLKRPDQVEVELRAVLRFWGRRPTETRPTSHTSGQMQARGESCVPAHVRAW